MNSKNLFWPTLAIVYLVGGSFTNSYVREYRYDKWWSWEANYVEHLDEYDRYGRSVRSKCEERTFLATALWPGYWLVHAFDSLLEKDMKLTSTRPLKASVHIDDFRR